MIKLFTKCLLNCLLFLFLSSGVFAQGSTTGNLNGKILDNNKEEIIGANVVAIHVPTGTRYGTVTGVDGSYFIPNMRVGGPYTVTVTYIGYQEQNQDNVYLKLGQTNRRNFTISESSTVLEAVTITGSKINTTDKTGTETTISEDMIESLPTLSRAIGDFARLTPQATVREGNDGYSISLGGVNNRYNAIYIDGAVNNDVFGLAGSGTNGGQTGVSPLSMDAIEEFQISLAPFDVTVGGFAGGAINAITRSGTNELEGSAYYLYRNESLAGRTPVDDDEFTRRKLNDFSGETYGFRLGGPIIKNKLFFFVNAEIQRDQTPQPFDLAQYQGTANRDSLRNLENKLSGFGYDPGTFEDNQSFLDSEKITAKFDYNLSDVHKISLKHSYVHAENLEGVQSGTRNIRYLNSSEFFDSRTNTTSLEVNSIFSNRLSNSLILGYTKVVDDRDPFGTPFPNVTINDGAGDISFGSEPFSTANLLNQTTFTVTNNLTLYRGKHNITIGTHNEFYKMENLFIAFNYGQYEFNSLDDFLNDRAAGFFQRSYSLRDNLSGDESAAIAAFNGAQVGGYIQDEIQVDDRLRVTLGLRADVPIFGDTPENRSFNSNTIPLVEAEGYDLRGARTGQFIKSQLMFSPRLGFNYDVSGDQKTILRGGIGIFTSRVPLVWPGGAYNNFGLNVGYTRSFNNTFEPDINQQLPGDIDLNNVEPEGSIDLFAEDFKVPQVLKLNVAMDHTLPGGIVANFDLLYNATIRNVAYQNVNLKQSVENLTGTGDNRPYFDRRDEIDPSYGRIVLGYNTSEGYSYNATASLSKQFGAGMFASVAYSYGDSYAVFDGTSSQNSSQWRGLNAVGGRNFNQPLTRSSFSQGHRVIATASKKFFWNPGKNIGTTITMFYEGVSGQPYSFTYDDNGNLNNEDSRERNLIYVPINESDINLVDLPNATAAEQWAALDRFIEEDDHLSERRGRYAQRNASRAPFSNVIDVKIIQDFGLTIGGKQQQFQVSLDIFNFTNLLNSKWGRRYFVFQNFQLMDFAGFQPDSLTPQFTYPGVQNNNPSSGNIDDSGVQSSRWQMQIGLRYIFN